MNQDLTLICQDCGNEFLWAAGEQEFYQEKGLEQPKFCPICRGRREAQEEWEAKRREKYGK